MKRGDLRLSDSQHLGSIGLPELPLSPPLVQRMGQAQFRLTLNGIGKAQVGEYIPGAASDYLVPFSVSACHSVPRSLFRRSLVVRRQDQHPESRVGYTQ